MRYEKIKMELRTPGLRTGYEGAGTYLMIPLLAFLRLMFYNIYIDN